MPDRVIWWRRGGGNFVLLLEVQCWLIWQREQIALIRGQFTPVIHPLCRFPRKREESGSLIKGAWLELPVIIGARNLNFKRSVQLHFEKCREAPRSTGCGQECGWTRFGRFGFWQNSPSNSYLFVLSFYLYFFLMGSWSSDFFFFFLMKVTPCDREAGIVRVWRAERSCRKLEDA